MENKRKLRGTDETRHAQQQAQPGQRADALGDIFTRVYLRMAGTGTVVPLGLDDTPRSYLFAPRTGVIDAFQSEKRSSLLDNDEFYRSRTLASRPVINSQWELVVNMVDEPANTDFRREDLTDIRLYFYYTDFVEF